MKCEWLLNVRYMANRPKKEMLPEAERHTEFDAGVNEIKQIWAHMKNFSQYCASCLEGKKMKEKKQKRKEKKGSSLTVNSRASRELVLLKGRGWQECHWLSGISHKNNMGCDTRWVD